MKAMNNSTNEQKRHWEPGDTVCMGDTSRFMWGDGPLEWYVLEIEPKENLALLFARKTICRRDYHDQYEKVRWKTCELRKWLNTEFYDYAFSEEEKAAIVPIAVSHSTNRGDPSDQNWKEETEDKLFLLSAAEVEDLVEPRYRGSDWNWWLRNPGTMFFSINNYLSAAYVNCIGEIDSVGLPICWIKEAAGITVAVRPVMVIDLTSGFVRRQINSPRGNADD